MPENPKPASPHPAPKPSTRQHLDQLRAKYDDLAKQVTKAAIANDNAALDKLRPEKTKAFNAWHDADQAAHPHNAEKAAKAALAAEAESVPSLIPPAIVTPAMP